MLHWKILVEKSLILLKSSWVEVRVSLFHRIITSVGLDKLSVLPLIKIVKNWPNFQKFLFIIWSIKVNCYMITNMIIWENFDHSHNRLSSVKKLFFVVKNFTNWNTRNFFSLEKSILTDWEWEKLTQRVREESVIERDF